MWASLIINILRQMLSVRDCMIASSDPTFIETSPSATCNKEYFTFIIIMPWEIKDMGETGIFNKILFFKYKIY